MLIFLLGANRSGAKGQGGAGNDKGGETTRGETTLVETSRGQTGSGAKQPGFTTGARSLILISLLNPKTENFIMSPWLNDQNLIVPVL